MSHRAWLAPAAFLCLASAPVVAAAQEAAPSMSPPKVLQIFVESVKPGKGAAHEKVETGWPAAYRKAKWPSHYLAMTSLSGPAEAWYVGVYESFAALETDQRNVEKAPALARELERLSLVDGELLTGTRNVLAHYRPDLSYRPDFDIAPMRYFGVTIITVNPGYDSAFSDARKLVHAAHAKANMDEHWAMYQVTSGMPGSTYLLFLPMKSLQEADVAQETHGKPYGDALGEAGRQQLRDFTRNSVATSETKLFAFSSKMSYPSAEWVARDPKFWAPKAVTAAKP
jgi:hypothetical protein